MSGFGKFSLGILGFALSTGMACASIIDQQNTSYNGYLGPSSSPGQSFTPTLSGIDFATFQLATSDPTNGALVSVVLYQGAGFGGSALATSNSVSITNASAFAAYEFDFATTVALTPGNVYTLKLVDSLGQTLYELEGSGNPYAGGVEYDSSGAAQNGYDLAFSEGTNTAQAPEPATFLTLSAGLAVLLGAVRRKTKAL